MGQKFPLRKLVWSAELLRLWGILISGQKYKGIDWLIAAGMVVPMGSSLAFLLDFLELC